MIQFQPGISDDEAWCMFAGGDTSNRVGPPDECAKLTAKNADALMAERAKRLTAKADAKPPWRCETCKHNNPDAAGGDDLIWCMKHQWGHDTENWGCSDWEAKL